MTNRKNKRKAGVKKEIRRLRRKVSALAQKEQIGNLEFKGLDGTLEIDLEGPDGEVTTIEIVDERAKRAILRVPEAHRSEFMNSAIKADFARRQPDRDGSAYFKKVSGAISDFMEGIDWNEVESGWSEVNGPYDVDRPDETIITGDDGKEIFRNNIGLTNEQLADPNTKLILQQALASGDLKIVDTAIRAMSGESGGLVDGKRMQALRNLVKGTEQEQAMDTALAQLQEDRIGGLRVEEDPRLPRVPRRLFWTIEKLIRQARSGQAAGSAMGDGSDATALFFRASKLLKKSRVIEVPAQEYIRLYADVDKFTTEMICGLPFYAAGDPSYRPLASSQYREAEGKIIAAGNAIPYPDFFPFNVTYFMFSESVQLSETNLIYRFGSSWRDSGIDRAALVGIIVSAAGESYEILVFEKLGLPLVNVYPVRRDGAWSNALVFGPWMVNGLVNAVNEHRTIIVEAPIENNRRVRNAVKKLNRRLDLCLVPQPYYRIKLQCGVFFRSAKGHSRGTREHIMKNFRRDRRGHERLFVRRGDLPLSDDMRIKLALRGYKVWVDSQVDDDTAAKLRTRCKQLKYSDEWIAVLSVWVKHHTFGPEGGVYVPAVRTMESMEPNEALLA